MTAKRENHKGEPNRRRRASTSAAGSAKGAPTEPTLSAALQGLPAAARPDASSGQAEVFRDVGSLIDPFRRELLFHCYRMTGSIQDAEDLVQETMLKAFRRFDTFRGASSLRTWLYAIATNVCLDALRSRRARTLPERLAPPSGSDDPVAPAIEAALWIEPFPDELIADHEESPEERSIRRESISLAFEVLLQVLPARQRAILILSDMLDFKAGEIAELLGISVLAVTSALHRARVTLEKNRNRGGLEEMATHRRAGVASSRADRAADGQGGDPAVRSLLERFLQAFEEDDVAGIVALMKEDAIVSMPPIPTWYRGREAIRALLAAKPFGRGIPRLWRLYPTRANGQAAFGLYSLEPSSGSFLPFGVQVATVEGAGKETRISALTVFHEPKLIAIFGLPPTLPPRREPQSIP